MALCCIVGLMVGYTSQKAFYAYDESIFEV